MGHGERSIRYFKYKNSFLQVTIILCVFLLSYVYGEGKVMNIWTFLVNIMLNDGWQSNYFKGSILVLTYLVIVFGFYLSGYNSGMQLMGNGRFHTLAIG